MAVYTQVSAEALARFLTRFDHGELLSAKGIAEGVENSNYLVDTTQGRFILTLYEKRVSADDLPFFLAMLDHLAARGNPVPRALPDRAGAAIQELEGRPACLIEFLPGVSVSHPTAAQAFAAGQAMGRMHASLADFAMERPNTLGPDGWLALFERCGARPRHDPARPVRPARARPFGGAEGLARRPSPRGDPCRSVPGQCPDARRQGCRADRLLLRLHRNPRL